MSLAGLPVGCCSHSEREHCEWQPRKGLPGANGTGTNAERSSTMRPTMQAKSWASLAGIAAMILAAMIFMSVGSTSAGAYESHWGANYFPNVELTDQYGHKLRFYDDLLKGKIVVIEQFYTHCIDICPLETARLVQVQKMLGDRVGKDIFFYSISIDPKRDT